MDISTSMWDLTSRANLKLWLAKPSADHVIPCARDVPDMVSMRMCVWSAMDTTKTSSAPTSAAATTSLTRTVRSVFLVLESVQDAPDQELLSAKLARTTESTSMEDMLRMMH